MPEDRFDDLRAADDRERPRAGERLAQLDGDPAPGPPEGRSFSRRYTWVVGVLAAIVIVIVGIQTLPHAGAGFRGPPAGRPAPRFAAVTAFGPVSGEPNVKQGPGDKVHGNRTPACDVRGPGIVTSCELTRRPLVLTFVGPGTRLCNRFLDRVEALTPRFPDVAFAAVVSGQSKGDVKRLARAHGWTFPILIDESHVLFDTYQVAVCATTTFVYRGGTVRSTKVLAQDWSDRRLAAVIGALAAGR